ncbi:MAG: hypothetical protein ABII25_06125 [bacterium]
MDSLIIYLIIGAVWIFQVLTKKKREAEIRQRPEEKEPERGMFDELKDLLEKKYQPDVFEEDRQEIELQMAEPVEEQQIEAMDVSKNETFMPTIIDTKGNEETPEPELEKPLSGLSNDVLEQGIILSVILGPPRSVQMMKRIITN